MSAERAEMPAWLSELVREHIDGAQKGGMRLGIKYAAKTLRDVVDEAAKDPSIAPDYLRGMLGAAEIIEQFAEKI